jgi:RNA polymerase sigma-B factor
VANILRDQTRAKRDRGRERPLGATGLEKCLLDERQAPSAQTEVAEYRAHVASVLNELTGPQRVVIRLRYWEGYSQAEIAARLGCSEASVSTLLKRALTKVKTGLSD